MKSIHSSKTAALAVVSARYPKYLPGAKETQESSHAAVTWLLLANSEFRLHPAGTGWLGACALLRMGSVL